MAAIRVEGLGKTFSVKKKGQGLLGSARALLKPQYVPRVAVESIHFAVGQGEMLAFLGPNGAGKSTTIKMLTGILHPTCGQADVLGYCPWTERKKLAYRIGSVFGQKSQLWYHLPPIDSFELMSRIYELKRKDYLFRRDDLVRRFELEPYMHTPVRKLSLGERMRCEIPAALPHPPQVLFLDEPTIGLDVVIKQKIRDLIREMNREEGMTVFLTSHDPGDIEQLCRRAIVINHGQVILDDRVTNMKRDFLTYKTIKLSLLGETPAFYMRGVELLNRDSTGMTLSVNTAITTIEAALTEIMRSCRIADVTIEDPPMEKIITHIYGHLQAGREVR